MRDEAGRRELPEGTPDRLRQITQRHTLSAILSVWTILVGLIVLPVIYVAVFYRDVPSSLTGIDLWRHVYLNAAANTFVAVTAARAAGRLDRQFAAVLSSVVMAHGMIAFLTLVLRIYYSNQLILTAAAVSVVASLAIIFARKSLHRDRAILIGPWHPILAGLKIAHDHLTTPPATLSGYDLVLTTTTDLPADWAVAVTHAMMAGKPVRHVAEYLEEEQGVVSIEHFHLDHLPVGGLASYQARKRAMDILLILIGAPFAVALTLLGACTVLVTMGRPVFFTQSRVGLGGRVFRMYKLRTMRPARTQEGQIATVRADARVTPPGRWLRRFRVDELPQLWNVLKGDMSLIGPRPEQPDLTKNYVQHLPAFTYRKLVRPGITGWAQVRAGYAADLEETRVKLSYDLFYLKNISFSLDLQIVLRTFGTLLTGRGVR